MKPVIIDTDAFMAVKLPPVRCRHYQATMTPFRHPDGSQGITHQCECGAVWETGLEGVAHFYDSSMELRERNK